MKAIDFKTVLEERPNEGVSEKLLRVLGELRRLEVLARDSYELMLNQTKKRKFNELVKGIRDDEIIHARLVDEMIKIVKSKEFNLEIVKFKL